MMNAADEKDMENDSMPSIPGIPMGNPFRDSLPPELQQARERKENRDPQIPDFLTRKPGDDSSSDDDGGSGRNPFLDDLPDFDTFKRQMESSNVSSTYDEDVPPLPSAPMPKPGAASDDLIDFDVDELVKKIDAKIAELEEEERLEKEKQNSQFDVSKGDNEKEAEVVSETDNSEPRFVEAPSEAPSTSSINSIYGLEDITEVPTEVKTTPPAPIKLDDSDDSDDDFFDDFFDN